MSYLDQEIMDLEKSQARSVKSRMQISSNQGLKGYDYNQIIFDEINENKRKERGKSE